MTIPTLQAAKTICHLSKWSISNLPLQKLLYLSHMIHLGKYEEPLIDGQFQAWDVGPVEPILYHKVKAYGGLVIVDIFPYEILSADSNEFKLITDVYNRFKDLAPGEFVSITHWNKGAWAKNYQQNFNGIAISNKNILDEYRERNLTT